MKIETAWRVVKYMFLTGAIAPIVIALLLLWLALGCAPRPVFSCPAPKVSSVYRINYVDHRGRIMRTDSIWYCA